MYSRNYIFQKNFIRRLLIPTIMLIGGIGCIIMYNNIAPTANPTDSDERLKNALVFFGTALLAIGGIIFTLYTLWNVVMSAQSQHFGKFLIPIIAIISGIILQNLYYIIDIEQEIISIFAFGALSLFCFVISIVWLISFLLTHLIIAIRSKNSVKIHKNT